MTGLGTYALPEIDGDDISSLSMTFYVQQRKYAHRVAVGVLENNGDFTEIGTFYNEGNYSSPVPHTVNFDSYSGSGKRIAFRNIAINSDIVSYNWIDDISIFVTPTVSCGIAVPYQQGFELDEQNGLECWSFIPDMEGNAAPATSTANPNSGSYSLYMSGLGVYALPEIDVDDISSLSMTFYVQQRKYAHRVAVGVLEDNGDFTEIGTFYNEGNYSSPVPHTVNFDSYSGSGKRIAFRNIAINTNNVSYNWIDDISIFTTDTRNLSASNNAFSADGENGYNDNLDEVTASLGVDEPGLADFNVWPNPTTGLLTLAAEAQRVEIVSLMGQRVAVFENTSSIDISDLTAGVYILKATLPQGEAVRKIVKR